MLVPAVTSQQSCRVLQVLTEHGFETSLRSLTDRTTAANAVVRQKREERIRCSPWALLRADLRPCKLPTSTCIGHWQGPACGHAWGLVWCACSPTAVAACVAHTMCG